MATRHGTVEVPAAARAAILDELRNVESARSAVAAFETVGVSRPVQLDRTAKLAVLDGIRGIAERARGFHNIEPGLFRLRNYLLDDVYGRIGD